jgi:hypothetical protein
MRSLKGNMIMALVGLLAGLSLVACDKKSQNGGGGQGCPAGFYQQNGTCVYDPNNTGNGGGGYTVTPGMGVYYGKNGHIVNMSKFKDFNLRVASYANQSAYWCYGGAYIYGVYFDCDDAYVALIKSGNNYYVQITSSSLTAQSITLPATKWGGSNTTQSVFEIFYSNPQPYKIAELVLNGDVDTAATLSYSLNYFTNATPSNAGYPMVTGTMTKSYDY